MSMYNRPSLKNLMEALPSAKHAVKALREAFAPSDGTSVPIKEPMDDIFVGGDTYVGQFEDKDWFMDTLRRLHAGDLSQRDIWLSRLELSLLTGTNDELENVVGMFYD